MANIFNEAEGVSNIEKKILGIYNCNPQTEDS